jgi:uncharacterized membrane protein YcaP (DUF421 family)
VDIVLRAAVAFAFIFAVTRTIGRRELGSMEPYDLILLVVIGDLIQQGVTQSDSSLVGMVLAIGTFAVLTIGISYVSFRFRRIRPFLDGEPIVLIEHGRVLDGNLRRERITVDELAAEARLQQIPSLQRVEWAVLETGGMISFIPMDPS